MKAKPFLVLAVVLLIAAAAFSCGWLILRNQATTAVRSWLHTVARGETEGMTGNPAQLAESLTWFEGFESSIESIALTTPTKARARIALSYAQTSTTLDLTVERLSGHWQVVAAPAAVTVVARTYAGQLYWRQGQALAPGTEPGQVVLALVVDGDHGLSRPLSGGTQDKLLVVGANSVEFWNQGTLETDSRFLGFSPQGVTNPLVGAMVEPYFLDGVLAALVVPEPDPRLIRVNISTNDYASLYHSQLVVANSGHWLLREAVSGETLPLPPGSVTFTPAGEGILVNYPGGSRKFEHRLELSAASPLSLTSVNRAGGYNPSCRGTLEVVNADSGLVVVNELDLESYLYTVIPSEMPLSFGTRALEVQAITARTYAVVNILSSAWQGTGAHVIDSVLSQVYNNTGEKDAALKAVDATAGRILVRGGQPAQLFFFSTSWGYSGSAHQVWSLGGEFPGAPVEGLLGRPQYSGAAQDLQEEAAFAAFLTSPPGDAYDQASPWFRWSFQVPEEQLTEIIVHNLRERHRHDPSSVSILEGRSIRDAAELPADPVGELLEINVAQRGDGGLLMAVDIVGSLGSWRVHREYNIRHVLRPLGSSSSPIVLNRENSTPIANFSLLPSAYVAWEPISSQGTSYYRFQGGGFGHGVGMSQYGVRELADRGWSREQILSHYFPGTSIENLTN